MSKRRKMKKKGGRDLSILTQTWKQNNDIIIYNNLYNQKDGGVMSSPIERRSHTTHNQT